MEKALELIMFCGLPASGKSTYSQLYKEKGYEVLSSDEIREEIQSKLDSGELIMPTFTNLNSMVFDQIKSLTANALKNSKSVVIDATNLGRRRRKIFLKQLYRTPCKKICYLFLTSIEECKRRNALRRGYAKVPDDIMQKMCCNIELPYYFDGFDEIVPIIDSTPVYFDYEWTLNFDQDNPHHTLTLGEHMQKAYDYAVENNYNDNLKEVIKYHDIGKYYTKGYLNSRGEVTTHAHFYGHENYGAYLYLTWRVCEKNLTKEQFEKYLYQALLINCHMRPLVLWKKQEVVKSKDKQLFGEEFFNDIVNLNKADIFAH